MAKKHVRKLSPANLEIMKIIWEKGEITVSSVVEAINAKRKDKLRRTTVQVQMGRLEEYGWLKHRAENTSLISRVPVFTTMASPHIPLKERVKHILSKERIMETKLKKSTLLVIVMISIFLICGIAGYRLAFASTESENLPEAAAKEMPIPQEKKKDTDQEKSSDKKIVPPKLIKKVVPVYPKEAHEKDIEGRVVLEATTDHEGRVTKIK